MEAKSIAACAAIVGALLAGCTQQPVQEATKPAASAKPEAYAVIPPKKDTDLKLYYADGRIVSGAAALGRMQQDAELILWLAGNQLSRSAAAAGQPARRSRLCDRRAHRGSASGGRGALSLFPGDAAGADRLRQVRLRERHGGRTQAQGNSLGAMRARENREGYTYLRP